MRAVWLLLGVAGIAALAALLVRTSRERERTQLAEVAASVVAAAHPGWTVQRKGPLELDVKNGSTSAVVRLDNAVEEAAGDDERFRSLVEETAQNLADAFDEGTATSFESIRQRLRPVLVPVSFADAQGLARRPFAGDVVETFVLDSPRRMTYVTKDQPPQWKVGLDVLHEQGVASLWQTAKADHFEPAAHAGGGAGTLAVVDTGDNYAAALLLVPAVRDALAKVLGVPYTAAVPNRDTLLACSGDYSAAAFASAVKDAFAKGGYPISSQVFRVEGDRVTPAP
ncbi:MAG TPA: hypothetical protein VH062_33235 [Polyangiaceae bacterium]|jgi:hypothetical protein|nr:hypothetical protein [Polyangiaceae bacterium]